MRVRVKVRVRVVRLSGGSPLPGESRGQDVAIGLTLAAARAARLLVEISPRSVSLVEISPSRSLSLVEISEAS